MAMVKCKSCGQEISKDAEACPKCGAPSKKKMGKGKGCLIAIIAVVVIAAIGSVMSKKEEKATLERVAAAPISNVTWEEIDKIYNLKSNNTELQKKEYWKNYKGQKVQWKGAVSSVGETFGTMSLQVKINPSTMTSDLLIKLKPTEREKAIKLKEGDLVTFVGLLDDWGTLMPVTIDQGEIVEK